MDPKSILLKNLSSDGFKLNKLLSVGVFLVVLLILSLGWGFLLIFIGPVMAQEPSGPDMNYCPNKNGRSFGPIQKDDNRDCPSMRDYITKEGGTLETLANGPCCTFNRDFPIFWTGEYGYSPMATPQEEKNFRSFKRSEQDELYRSTLNEINEENKERATDSLKLECSNQTSDQFNGCVNRCVECMQKVNLGNTKLIKKEDYKNACQWCVQNQVPQPAQGQQKPDPGKLGGGRCPGEESIDLCPLGRNCTPSASCQQSCPADKPLLCYGAEKTQDNRNCCNDPAAQPPRQGQPAAGGDQKRTININLGKGVERVQVGTDKGSVVCYSSGDADPDGKLDFTFAKPCKLSNIKDGLNLTIVGFPLKGYKMHGWDFSSQKDPNKKYVCKGFERSDGEYQCTMGIGDDVNMNINASQITPPAPVVPPAASNTKITAHIYGANGKEAGEVIQHWKLLEGKLNVGAVVTKADVTPDKFNASTDCLPVTVNLSLIRTKDEKGNAVSGTNKMISKQRVDFVSGQEKEGKTDEVFVNCQSYKADIKEGNQVVSGTYELTASYRPAGAQNEISNTISIEVVKDQTKATIRTVSKIAVTVGSTTIGAGKANLFDLMVEDSKKSNVAGVSVIQRDNKIILINDPKSTINNFSLTPSTTISGESCDAAKIPIVHFSVKKVFLDNTVEPISLLDDLSYKNCNPYSLSLSDLGDISKIAYLDAEVEYYPQDENSLYEPSKGKMILEIAGSEPQPKPASQPEGLGEVTSASVLFEGQTYSLSKDGSKKRISGLRPGSNTLLLIIHHERGDEPGKSFTVIYEPVVERVINPGQQGSVEQLGNECEDGTITGNCGNEKGAGHYYCHWDSNQNRLVKGTDNIDNCVLHTCTNGANNPPDCDNGFRNPEQPTQSNRVCDRGTLKPGTYRVCKDANTCTYEVDVCKEDETGYTVRGESNCDLATENCRPQAQTQDNDARSDCREIAEDENNGCAHYWWVCNGQKVGDNGRWDINNPGNPCPF